MFESIPALMASLGHANNLSKSALSVRDQSLLSSKIAELNSTIIQAQDHVLSIQKDYSLAIKRINSLEEELSEIKATNAQLENYKLVEIVSGVFCYIEKSCTKPYKDATKFCETCYGNGKKSVLQSQKTHKNISVHLFCNTCNSSLKFPYYKG